MNFAAASKVPRPHGVRRQSAAATALWAAWGSLVLADHLTGWTTKRRRASLATALPIAGDAHRTPGTGSRETRLKLRRLSRFHVQYRRGFERGSGVIAALWFMVPMRFKRKWKTSPKALISIALTALLGLGLTHGVSICAGATILGERVATLKIEKGDLSALFRDNAESPKILSGVDALFHVRTDLDAFDPDSQGASAGLNFEHVISGHPNPANSFTPRRGRYDLLRQQDGMSAVLVRNHPDDPWAFASTFRYTVTEPHYIDFEFQGEAHKAALFGQRGYAVLFFANYMNDVADVPIHFRGIEAPGAPEKWIRAEAPPGHPDYNGGGTYRSISAEELTYDKDHNFKLNLWSYDYPRFSQPFYYGRAAGGMTFILMFDRMYSTEDEIRFSLFKFKLPRHPRPAWDFQYVIHKVQDGKPYGFKGRLVWKKFISAEDCEEEFRRWHSGVIKEGQSQALPRLQK